MCRFFFLILFLSKLVVAQGSLSLIPDRILKSAHSNYEKIDQLEQFIKVHAPTKDYPSLSLSYHNIGVCFYKEKEYNKAIESTNKAIALRKKSSSMDFFQLNRSYNNLYFFYKALGDNVNKRKALDAIISHQKNDKYTLSAYLNLAEILTVDGDYFKALSYLDIVSNELKTQEFPQILLDAHIAYVYTYAEMATPNRFRDEIEKHKIEVEKLAEYVPKNKLANFNANLGKIYETVHAFDLGELYYKKAAEHYTNAKDSLNLAIVYNNLMAIGVANNEPQKALRYFERVNELTRDHRVLSAAQHRKGLIKEYTYNEQNYFFREAIFIALKENENSWCTDYLPDFDRIANADHKTELLLYLKDFAKNLVSYYEHTQNKMLLVEAKKVIYIIDELISLIRLESSQEHSKLYWVSKGVDSYLLGVKICYFLKQPKEAFYFMEKNKSLVLLENLKGLKAKQNKLIPKNVLAGQYNLQVALLKHKRSRRSTPNKLGLEQKIISLTKQLQELERIIQKNYPDYVKSRKQLDIISFEKALEKHVDTSRNFMEFILNDHEGYAIFCSPDEILLYELNDVPNLLKNIGDFKKILSAPFVENKAVDYYRMLAKEIFRSIFDFKNAEALIKGKHLTIVPDFELQNLPFEALQFSTGNQYLINEVSVSYLQSSSVYDLIALPQERMLEDFLGIAPSTFNEVTLSNLDRSEQQMKSIQNSFHTSSILTNAKASKSAFLKGMNAYKIIHLNTHAGINALTREPWLAFHDKLMNLSELYGLENSVDLVVLDACKSASGTLEQGEGVMSWSRGFFYNGAKSVIASHWNANEKSTNTILRSFYQYLKEGKSKSTALRDAKLDYLDTHQLSETSPYYWASLSLTGATASIEFEQPFYTSTWFIGILLLLLVLVSVFFYKNKILS